MNVEVTVTRFLTDAYPGRYRRVLSLPDGRVEVQVGHAWGHVTVTAPTCQEALGRAMVECEKEAKA